MRIYILAIAAVLCSFTPSGKNKNERLGVPGPMAFGQTKFELAWTDKPNGNYYIQEYLPKGETPEHFHKMLTIHLFVTNLDLEDVVRQKVAALVARRKTDLTCQYQVSNSPDGKEMLVDFLMGESKDEKMTIVEFNIYRYKQVDLGGMKRAILVYAFSQRAYGEEIIPFYNQLVDNKTALLNSMISSEVPKVVLSEN